MAAIHYDVIIFFAILILCASFNCIFIIKTSASSIKTWKRNTSHTLDIVINLIFILSSIFLILNVIFDLFSYPQSLILITNTTGCALHMFGLPLVLFSFAWRLNQRFKGTQYRSQCCDIVLIIIVFLAVIIQILSFILMVCVTLMNLMSLALINYLVFSLTNLVSNVALLCTFGHKIHTLGQQTHTYDLHDESHTINSGELAIELTKSIESSTETKSKSKSSTQRTASTKINSKQKPKAKRRPRIIKNKLLTKTIQNMTGALIAFISSNLMSILSIYRMNNKRLWIIHLMFITMDQTINVLCLYQRQKQSRSCYNKHCATLHGCIGKMLIGNPSKQDYKCNETSYTQSVNMVPQEHSIRPYSTTSTLSTLTESSARTTPHGLPHLQLRPDHVSEMESSETSSFPHLWPDGE
eukprot:34276_1